MAKKLPVALAVSVVLGFSAADVSGFGPAQFFGTESLSDVTQDVLASCPVAVVTPLNYVAIGSAAGASAMATHGQQIARWRGRS